MTFEINGKRFHLVVDGARVSCRPEDPSDAVLCNSVTSGWDADPRQLLEAVDAGHGLGLQNNAGFTYYDDAPAEVEVPDTVVVDYLDEESTLGRADFERFVADFARRTLEAGAGDRDALLPLTLKIAAKHA